MSTAIQVEMTEEELVDEYLTVAFANGFSKGTANVSPADMKKLRPLLNYYRKKPHPFRACVRDNRKRFGPRTEAICAVVKDLIKGHTKWRNQKKSGNMSWDDVQEFILEDAIPDEFIEWLGEIEEDDIVTWAKLSQGDVEDDAVPFEEDVPVLGEMYFEAGDAEPEDGMVWKTILREGVWKMSPGEDGEPKRKPITIVKSGDSDAEKMVISMSEIHKNFKDKAIEHVNIPMRHSGDLMDNTGFARDLRIVQGDNGKWELQAALDFTEPEIKEKISRGTIANTSAGIVFNFIRKLDGKKFRAALDHIALTNKPWIDGLKPFGAALEDEELEDMEAVWFSEDPMDLSQSLHALRGAVDGLRLAVREEDDEDKKSELSKALELAVNVLVECEREYGAGEDDEVADKAEYSADDTGGGDKMAEKDKKETTTEQDDRQDDFLHDLGLSEDEVRARLARYDELEAEDKRRSIDAKVKKWEDDKRSPAVIKEAERFLLADEGTVVVYLSQDGGKSRGYGVTEIVERLVAASPKVELEDVISDEDQTGDKPADDAKEENAEAELSREVKALASSMLFDGQAKTEKDAIALAQKELGEVPTK